METYKYLRIYENIWKKKKKKEKKRKRIPQKKEKTTRNQTTQLKSYQRDMDHS